MDVDGRMAGTFVVRGIDIGVDLQQDMAFFVARTLFLSP